MLKRLQQRPHHGHIAVRRLNKELGLPGFQGQRFQLANSLRALGRIGRQVAHKRKILAVESAGCQRQQQRHRPHQRQHGNAQIMRRPHDRRARVGYGGHAGFAHQSHVMALQRGGQQVIGVKLAVMVAFFMHFARKLLNL